MQAELASEKYYFWAVHHKRRMCSQSAHEGGHNFLYLATFGVVLFWPLIVGFWQFFDQLVQIHFKIFILKKHVQKFTHKNGAAELQLHYSFPKIATPFKTWTCLRLTAPLLIRVPQPKIWIAVLFLHPNKPDHCTAGEHWNPILGLWYSHYQWYFYLRLESSRKL